MVLMSTEADFLDYWNSKYKKKAEGQFRPQKGLYLKEKSAIKYRDWLRINRLADYKADFAIKCNSGFVRWLTVEFDGAGFGHSGPQAERDRQKTNQFLRLGCLTMRFSVTTLKSSFGFVEDMIRDQYFIIKKKHVK
jgi:very-short-patch-repair endonuclease